MLIIFYKDSDENLRRAMDEYVDELKNMKNELNLYELFSISVRSSAGNQYEADGVGWDHKPTDEELKQQALQDWKKYFEGQAEDAFTNKNGLLSELIANYLIVKTDDFPMRQASNNEAENEMER